MDGFQSLDTKITNRISRIEFKCLDNFFARARHIKIYLQSIFGDIIYIQGRIEDNRSADTLMRKKQWSFSSIKNLIVTIQGKRGLYGIPSQQRNIFFCFDTTQCGMWSRERKSKLLGHLVSKGARTNLRVRHSSGSNNDFFCSIYASRSSDDECSVFSITYRIHFMTKQMFDFIFFGFLDKEFYELFGFTAFEQYSPIVFDFGLNSMFIKIVDHIFWSKLMEQ